MAVDLSTLAIAVDSSAVPRAVKELDKLTESGKKAETATTALSKAWQEYGGLLTGLAAFSTVTMLITKFAAASIEAEENLRQLEAVVESTGSAAGLSVPQLVKMSEKMQSLTTYSDDAVQQMQAVLLGFTNIGGPIVERAQMAIANLATRMGGDLKGAAMQVGKALNDPLESLSMLERSIGKISPVMKNMIKDMAESGNIAGAQSLILRELETRYGGAAEAARNTLGGALKGLKNDFDNLFEIQSGMPELASVINFVAKNLDKIVIAFQGVAIAATAYIALELASMFASQVAAAVAYVTALNASKKATVEAAEATLAKTTAEIASNIANKEAIILSREYAVVQLRLATTEQQRAVVMAELALLGQQQARVTASLTAATAAQTAAQAGLTAAQAGGAGVAATVGTRLLGLLGPIGWITTILGVGYTAWQLWGSGAKKAEEEAAGSVEQSTQEIIAQLQKQIDKLNERNNLRDKLPAEFKDQAGSAGSVRVGQITSQMESIAKGEGAWSKESMTNRQNAINALGKELAGLLAVMQELNAAQGREKGANNKDAAGEWMLKYATNSEKLTAELTKAKAALGDAFTPELERRIRAAFPNPSDTGLDALVESTKKLAESATAAKLAIAQAGLSQEMQVVEANYREGITTMEEYFAAKQSLTLAGIALEKTAVEEQLSAVQKQIESLSRLSVTEKDANANRAKIMDAAGKEIELKAKLVVLDGKHTEVIINAVDARKKQLEAVQAATRADRDQLEALKDEYATLGMTTKQIDAYKIAKLQAQIETMEFAESLGWETAETKQWLEIARERIKLMKEGAGIREQIEEGKKLIGVWDQIGTSAGNFFSDLVTNGKSAFDSLKSSLKSFVQEIVAFFAKKWVLNMVAGGAGSLGLTDIASAASSASNAMGGAGSVASSLYSRLFPASGVPGTGAFSAQTPGGMWTLPGEGGTTAGFNLAAAAPYMVSAIVGGITGYFGSRALGAGERGQRVGGLSGATLATVGFAFGGPVGAAIGAVLGAVIGKFTDPDGLAQRTGKFGTNPAGNYSMGGGVTSAFGTFGTFDDKWFSDKDMGEGMKAFFAGIKDMDNALAKFMSPEQVARVKDNLAAATKEYNFGIEHGQIEGLGQILKDRLTIITAEISPALSAMVAAFQGTSTELLAMVDDWLAIRDITEALKKSNIAGISIEGIKAARVEGETLNETFNRIQLVFAATSQIADSAFGRVGFAGLEMRQALIEAAGGMEKFVTSQQAYIDAFYNDTEKQAMGMRALREQFDSLGVAMPTTRAGFRELIDNMISTGALATESGRTLYNALIELAPAFASLIPAVNAVGTAVNAVGTAVNAVGTAVRTEAEERQNELAARDMAIRIMKLEGDAIGALAARRELELAGYDLVLDANLIAYQRRIWALEDEQTALERAAAATRNAAQAALQLANSVANVGRGITATTPSGRANPANSGFDIRFLQAQQRTAIEAYARTAYADYTQNAEGFADIVARVTANVTNGTINFDRALNYAATVGAGAVDALGNVIQANNALYAALNPVPPAVQQVTQSVGSAAVAIDAMVGAIENLVEYLNDSKLSNLSPLTPEERFIEAQAQYVENLVQAQRGNADAVSNFGRARDAYLQEARAMFGSNQAYSDIFNSTFNQGAGLSRGQVAPLNAADLRGSTQSIVASLAEVRAAIEQLRHDNNAGDKANVDATNSMAGTRSGADAGMRF